MDRMRSLNRLVAVIKPNQTFLQWLKYVTDDNKKLTLEEAREDCFAFLIPEYDTINEAQEFILGRSRELLETILESWYIDEEIWPPNLDPDLFREWFDIEIHSEVVDLAGEEMVLEDYEF